MEIEFLEAGLPAVAKKLKGRLRSGDVVGLSGQLAAGKTRLVGELARAYGYAGRVSSPTFVIEHRYPLDEKGRIKEIVHLDLYRLNKKDLPSIDWDEYRHLDKALILVEWSERLPAGLLPFNKQVNIEIINEKKRRLTLRDNPGN